MLNRRNSAEWAAPFSIFASCQTANALFPDAARPVIAGEMKGLAVAGRRLIGLSKLVPPSRLALTSSSDGGDGIRVESLTQVT